MVRQRTRKPAKGGTSQSERVDVELGRFSPDGSISVDLGGRQVAVEGGIPTETVRLSIVPGGRRDRPRAEIAAVIDRAGDRVETRCPIIDQCGGCEWQHIASERQMTHKAAIVRRLLAAQRLPTRIDGLHSMPDPWGYRIRAQIALADVAGFRMRRAKRIVRVTNCVVSHPLISRLLEDLNRLLRLKRLPDLKGHVELHVQVTGSPRQPQLQLLLVDTVGGKALSADVARSMADELAQLRDIESVHWRIGEGPITTLVGEPYSCITLGGRELLLPAGAFFQSNWSLVSALVARAMELADADPDTRAADVYGGVGVFGLQMAAAGAEVTMIELDPIATAAAAATAERWGITLDVIARPAEEAFPDLHDLDVVLVDPPRTGLHSSMVAALLELKVARLVYVACSPLTFARDAGQLVRGGYRMASLELFDFYPQTVHVESVALFEWG